MEMVLLDWTRMGRSFCVAGALFQDTHYRLVRPLLAKNRQAPVRNVGWPAYLLERHFRWEIFELIGHELADPQLPHAEDIWVQALRPRNRLASREQRRAILEATAPKPEESLFGAPLLTTRFAAYLPPGTGRRSLTTIIVPGDEVSFSFSRREGAPEPDIRVMLPVPPMGERLLIVKDHHLLRRAEESSSDPVRQIATLNTAVMQMGERVAVRLGLSRPFQSDARQPAMCWLMADGFFSLYDPQP
jgi:hypothetical protein